MQTPDRYEYGRDDYRDGHRRDGHRDDGDGLGHGWDRFSAGRPSLDALHIPRHTFGWAAMGSSLPERPPYDGDGYGL